MQTQAFSLVALSFYLFQISWTSPHLYAAEISINDKVIWSANGKSSMKIIGDSRIIEMEDNVEISQGTMKVKGDFAVIEYLVSTGELQKILVEGQPVHYQQRIGLSNDLASGTSASLSIDKETGDTSTNAISLITLVGNATLQSPSANMQCAAIIYAAELDLIREAEGPCKGELESSKE
jgi:lipopolysaccharide transport protein LptA